MRRILIIFAIIVLPWSLSSQNSQLRYSYTGVDDELVNNSAKDIISSAIGQSHLQYDDEISYKLEFKSRTLKISYSSKVYGIKGDVRKENADLYADLKDVLSSAVAKSLEELEVATRPKEIAKPVETVATPDNVIPPKEVVVNPEQKTSPVVNNVPASDRSSQINKRDNGEVWQKIKNFITAPKNKSDKIVSLKTAGKLSTFTTLKSGLTAELTDEGVLKINGTGRMLTEDESLLKSLRPYVIAIEVEEGVTDVCGFQQFASVQYVLLPNSVCRIASGTFKDCIKLLSINIPEATTEIGSSAFQNCEVLSAIVLPNGLLNIGDKAFMGCRKLQSINLPSSISIIAESVFRNCQSLESMDIPSSVTHIKENAFKNCRSIDKLYLSNNVVVIEKGCFQDMKKLTEVRLSEKLISIPSSAFESCSSLNSIVVPQNVQVVGEYAFKGCENLVQITFLCQNMRSIGKFSFEDCNRLYTISLHSQYPPTVSELFDDKNITSRVVIMVPSSSLSFYADADYWKTLNIRSM